MITVSDALISLGIDGGWKIKDKTIVKWWTDKLQPTEEHIQTRLSELRADFDAKKYQRDRNYPGIGDQLDMIYWDKVNGTEKWKETIDAVKQADPKPE